MKMTPSQIQTMLEQLNAIERKVSLMRLYINPPTGEAEIDILSNSCAGIDECVDRFARVLRSVK